MGRKEFGVGQDAREARRQTNQIIAVGADAVQQDDKLGGFAALKGSERRSRKIARKIERCVDGPLPPYAMPARKQAVAMAPSHNEPGPTL